MTIYIIPAWYPKSESDVTACFFREQAHALSENGNEVTVIHIEPVSFTRMFRQKYHEITTWQDGSVRTIFHKVVIPVPGKIPDIQDKYISNVFYSIIRDQIGEDQNNGLSAPDIIHAHVSHSCAYYCLKASKKLHIPIVTTEHYSGLLIGTATKREYDRVRETINSSDGFIFVGSRFQKSICDRLSITKDTYVIPNMIDTDIFYIQQKKENVFIFLVACHLKKNKSVDLVIRAFHDAFKDNEKVRLVVAGDGEERALLESLSEELKEKDRIQFKGKYSREDAAELFSKANAFVLTSEKETFGIVYIEALACGLPCIGTKGQGAEDIITDENGFTVEYGNIEELALRMKELYNSKMLYDPIVIRKSCVERFGKKSICNQLEVVYNEVLQKGETK